MFAHFRISGKIRKTIGAAKKDGCPVLDFVLDFQHMENGMKGQLVVGEGSGDLWSIKEVGGSFTRSAYLPAGYPWLLLPVLLLGAGLALMSRRSG